MMLRSPRDLSAPELSTAVSSAHSDIDLRAQFLARAASDADFDYVFRDDADCFESETGRLLFRFRKKVLSEQATALARRSYADIDTLERPSVTRRAAAGKVELSRFQSLRGDLAEIIPLTPTTCRLKLLDGRVLRQPMSNPVHSYLAGYGFQRFERRAVKNLLTNRYPERWDAALPFFQEIDGVHAALVPDVNRDQSERCRAHPQWIIPGTALSTVTINVNYQSHYHWDTGDYAHGFSTLTVVEIGPYDGGYLVFPKYRIAVDVREGDLLVCQSHVEMHGNMPITGPGKRVSFVTYLKHKLAEAVNREDSPNPQRGRRNRADSFFLSAASY